MATTDLFLAFPNVLKITPEFDEASFTDDTFIEPPIMLSITSDIKMSMSSEPLAFPVDSSFVQGRGAKRNINTISVAGVVCDDPVWGLTLQLGGLPISTASLSLRRGVAKKLEELLAGKINVTLTDQTFGTRKHYILTGLDYGPSLEYEDTTEFQLTFSEQPRIERTNATGDVKSDAYVDPFMYYDYEVK